MSVAQEPAGEGMIPPCFDPALAELPTRVVPLDRIVDPLEVSHAPERIAAYRDAMMAGARFPPIAVLPIRGRYVVVDGHKRFGAYRALPVTEMVVELWTLRRWLRDQWQQLSRKTRQQARVLVRAAGDPRARGEAVRLARDTLAHWRRIARSVQRLLPLLSSPPPYRGGGWGEVTVSTNRLGFTRPPPNPLLGKEGEPDLLGAGTMVLVPTYMEAATICRLIEELRRHLPAATILIVDDQSPDGTAELVRARYGDGGSVAVMMRQGPRGFGPALRAGMQHFLESRAARLITIDADLSHDPALTTRMLAAVGPEGLAIGSRYLVGRPRVEWALGRMLTSRLGNLYVRAVTGLPVKDCTSGFRCYSRAALERLDLGAIRTSGYAFQVEMLYWIWQAGCLITEVEIVYRDRLYGESKLGLPIVIESLTLPWHLVLRREARSALKPIALGHSRGRPAA